MINHLLVCIGIRCLSAKKNFDYYFLYFHFKEMFVGSNNKLMYVRNKQIDTAGATAKLADGSAYINMDNILYIGRCSGGMQLGENPTNLQQVETFTVVTINGSYIIFDEKNKLISDRRIPRRERSVVLVKRVTVVPSTSMPGQNKFELYKGEPKHIQHRIPSSGEIQNGMLYVDGVCQTNTFDVFGDTGYYFYENIQTLIVVVLSRLPYQNDISEFYKEYQKMKKVGDKVVLNNFDVAEVNIDGGTKYCLCMKNKLSYITSVKKINGIFIISDNKNKAHYINTCYDLVEI